MSVIQKYEKTFNCHVRNFVTDTAAYVAKMRQECQEDRDLVTYGCSAHLLNLQAKDATKEMQYNTYTEIHTRMRIVNSTVGKLTDDPKYD